VIKIVNEQVQGADALDEALLDARPFRGGNNARNQVERKRFFDPRAFAIDVESDAGLDERAVSGDWRFFNSPSGSEAMFRASGRAAARGWPFSPNISSKKPPRS
jgi:hypothetical protein